MTPLRQRLSEDLRLRNFAPLTQRRSLDAVAKFAQYFGRSPDQLGPAHLRTYQLHLLSQQLSSSSLKIVVSAVRFFYHVTLGRNWAIEEIPSPRQPRTLPVMLSLAEVAQFLGAITTLKHRAALRTAYAAGLRVSGVVNLKVTDLDSQRLVIRVQQGKGRKDRSVMLSPQLCLVLRPYWRAVRPTDWLFPGRPGMPLSVRMGQIACRQAPAAAGLATHVTVHPVGHGFATQGLEAGTDVRTIPLLLGHRSLATTACSSHGATTTVGATPSPLALVAALPHAQG